MSSIITLTTDFGLQDHYVGAMKAVMLGINPNARLVDISHDVPPQDIMAGAWILRNSAMLFPPNTVHLVVVDPGVGTDRNPVAVHVEDQYFVGPDNGIFSLIGEDFDLKAVRINNSSLWRKEQSDTFHGRDIFAPVAANLAGETPFEDLGEPISELVSYKWAIPISDRDGIQGWVVHIDRFGNLVTNISASLIRESSIASNFKIYVGNAILKNIEKTFSSVADGEPVAYIGSSGNLEIAINKGNAREMLDVKKGAQVSIITQK